jgi:hypothetical protein
VVTLDDRKLTEIAHSSRGQITRLPLVAARQLISRSA